MSCCPEPPVFPAKLPGASIPLTFGFAAALVGGATITGIVSITVTALCGLDPAPNSILNGAATVSGANVLQPVQGGVWGERYLFKVIINTSTPGLSPELVAVLPVGISNSPIYYNDARFRQQFPAFASKTSYPPASLEFAWNTGANYVSQTPARWGLGAENPCKLQQAADLMGAVITYQLYGPASGGVQQPSEVGEAPGAVMAAAEGSVNAQFQLPEIGTSAFSSMLLASPPYGRMLLALLQISASVGPYIGSRRPAYIPP